MTVMSVCLFVTLLFCVETHITPSGSSPFYFSHTKCLRKCRCGWKCYVQLDYEKQFSASVITKRWRII